MRLTCSSIAIPAVLAALLAGCSSSTGPVSCSISPASALTTGPNFTGVVGRIVLEDGVSADGRSAQLDVWVAVPPSTDPNHGVAVDATAAVFTRTASGELAPSNRCAIAIGDVVEVWTGFSGPPQYTIDSSETPAYSAVQIVVQQ